MEESFETKEMKEQLEEAAERIEERAAPRWMVYLALSTAMVAVLAAIASLESGSLSNEAILYKNEAVLSQSKASDQWSYYQAKGIKSTVYLVEAAALKKSNSALATQYENESKRYKDEQTEINKAALELEGRVKENNERSENYLEHHHLFALAVTLFQVSIALSAIASLSRKRALWIAGLLICAVGLLYFIKGMAFVL